jgi:hypothetical protein
MFRSSIERDSYGRLTKFRDNFAAGLSPSIITNVYSTTFNGINQYISFGTTNLNFDYTDSFSISMWLKSNGVHAGCAVMSKFYYPAGWMIGFHASPSGSPLGALLLELNETVAGTGVFGVGSTNVDTAVWKHVVAAWDGAGAHDYTSVKLFLNGAVDPIIRNTGANVIDATIKNSHDAMMCKAADGRAAGVRADQVSVYNKVLSLAEVQEIYNGGKPNNLTYLSSAPNLLYWWFMGDGDTHPTIIDSYGSLDGTMINMSGANFVTDVP